ncbi:MAG: DUF4185 domain-containing protein [Nocardiaceae bacterium]|nr:DUF4185 domain-containing protein [Nocardiaceae bacterium]
MRHLTRLSLALATVGSSIALPLVATPAATAAPCNYGAMSTSATGSEIVIPNAPIGRKPSYADQSMLGKKPQPLVSSQAIGPVTFVQWLGGRNSPNNTAQRFGVTGSDLGIPWDNGQSGSSRETLYAFGDTFGNCSVSGQEWRNNILFRSADANLADGIAIPDPAYGNIYAGSPVLQSRTNFSKQIIPKLGIASPEITIIPTAAISIGSTQYINFMSVRQWGQPGSWTTNYAAIAFSSDNGETWSVPLKTVRANTSMGTRGTYKYAYGNEKFQMNAYVRKDGYLYQYGTPNGRNGSAYLARVPENAILDLTQYRYWTGSTWSTSPRYARAVFGAPVSELSVAWNAYLGKYIAMYTNNSGVVMRTATNPQGPWSSATTVLSPNAIPGGIYAPYIHPWSSGNTLYFTLSLWSEYNVMLLKMTL